MRYLRNASLLDKDILFHWANEDEVRKNSFNTKKIMYNEHLKWLEQRLCTKKCDIYILMDKEIPIGQIRLEYIEDVTYIDYSIQSDYRNMGYGTCILKLLEAQLKENKISTKLTAQVKKQNIPSIQLFNKLKYSCVEYENYLEFIKAV